MIFSFDVLTSFTSFWYDFKSDLTLLRSSECLFSIWVIWSVKVLNYSSIWSLIRLILPSNLDSISLSSSLIGDRCSSILMLVSWGLNILNEFSVESFTSFSIYLSSLVGEGYLLALFVFVSSFDAKLSFEGDRVLRFNFEFSVFFKEFLALFLFSCIFSYCSLNFFSWF